MIGTALALGAASSLAGGIGNAVSNMSAQDRAAALQDKGLQAWLKVNIPDPKEQQEALTRFVDQGELSPKLEQSIRQNPSEFQKIASDVTDRSAQNRALSELQNIGYNGGLRLQDKAALQDAMMNGEVQDKANREGIESDMARRGLGGSGFDFASQLQAQQSGSDRNARSSLSVAAQAQDRALQSIMQAGDLASKNRSQDFSEQAQKAQAQDAINKFNVQNLQDVQQRNISSQNQAAQYNLAQKQKTADQNVGVSNQEEAYNKGLAQQQFENQAKVAAGQTGQYDKMAGTAQQQGQTAGNAFSNAGGALGGVAQAQGNSDYWTDYFNKKKQQSQTAGS
jgi:hypothetical protein